MTPDERFREAMLADPDVSEIIGQRFFLIQLPPNMRPENFPAAVAQRVSTQRLYSHSADTAGTFGWCRMQVTAIASTKDGGAAAVRLAQALIEATRRFNLSANPASPAILRQAPNFVLQQSNGVMPDTQQPLFTSRLDLKVYFNDL